jgi:YbbR domain-containing protein
MSWRMVTAEWRLKLLALVLAILMLGAVAFSETRPTSKPVTVGLNYTVPPNIILINPPSKTTVTVAGLADALSRVDASNGTLTATVDATRALPGAAVRLNVTARSTVQGVQVQSPPPIVVHIDTLQAVDIPVLVVARAQTGWSINPSRTLATCPGAANPNPCKVRFSGPVSWESGLRAIVTISSPVVGSNNFLNQPIQLQTQSGSLDLSVRTVPNPSSDVNSADVHIEAVAGTTSESVPLVDSPPSHPPPTGYRVTAVTITPLLVTISGDPAALLRVSSIILPSQDLSSSTSDATFQVAIPYPNGVSGTVANATVKYSIARNPNVSPSASPSG